MLVPFWYHFGITLGPCWDHFEGDCLIWGGVSWFAPAAAAAGSDHKTYKLQRTNRPNQLPHDDHFSAAGPGGMREAVRRPTRVGVLDCNRALEIRRPPSPPKQTWKKPKPNLAVWNFVP